MSIFSSIFGKKDNNVKVIVSTPGLEKAFPVDTSKLHLKGTPDVNGLYPSELVMLAVAEKYNTMETNFPSYFMNNYEIANPAKMLKNLQSKGYIEVGSSKDSLGNFKLPELKEIATFLGITVKGKKADIISRLSEVEEEHLAQFVKERNWKLTDSGQEALKANPYIQYFLEKHPYNVAEVGIDIWTVNKEFVKNPKRPFRDIIYKQLNDRMNNASIALQKDPARGSSNSYQYCECYRLMSLFVEEEGKSYINAADLYFQYIFKRINIHAGIQLLMNYSLFKNDKKYQNEMVERYYDDIQLYPFHKTELLRLIDELGIDGGAVREALITSFKRAKDTGIMTENEIADFVILELNGESDKSRDLADKLVKKAIKRIR
ncbi:MAG: SAP domain-containing protein [Clostridia bacterium]|nr:SAP domain-containing protein [Clostridia bacterium]